MEIGVRLFGAVQLFLSWITAPLFLLLSWKQGKRCLPPITDPLLELSLTQLADKIRRKELTSEQVVRAYIKRCKTVNPYLNAVVEERYEEATKEAISVDQLITSRTKTIEQLERDTPLLGVPITVKESCGIKGLSQSVGCKLKDGVKAQRDGEAVENLRKAGAIPIAVTNTPELCLCWESNNLITGRTYNPYNFTRTSGGSSGGESALISSAASVAGIGSDIAGSIRLPSMFTGIFGHKPTPGYVSLAGHYPYAPDDNFERFLTIGPMTRYASDLKPMLKAMAGKSAEGLRLDENVDLKNLNIHYLEEPGFSLVMIRLEKEIRLAIRKALNHLEANYGCPVNKANIPELVDSVEISTSVFFGMHDLPNLMTMANPEDPKKKKNVFVELFKSLFGMSDISFPAIMFTILQETNCLIPRSKYKYYYEQNEKLQEKFKEMLGTNGVFIYPTHPIPAYQHNQFFMKTAGIMYTMVFNTLCLPATNVPMGLDKNGLPIGIQVVAGPHQDRLCLAVAKELERAFKGWVPPPSS